MAAYLTTHNYWEEPVCTNKDLTGVRHFLLKTIWEKMIIRKLLIASVLQRKKALDFRVGGISKSFEWKRLSERLLKSEGAEHRGKKIFFPAICFPD